MSRIIKLISVITALALTAVIFASCGGNNTASQTDNSTQSAEETSAEETTSESADFDYSAVDYSNVAVSISTFDEMEDFLDAWNNNTYDDKVVEITGRSAHRTSNCSILIADKDNSMSKGCSWEIIDGKYPDDYPADDAQVKVKGVLRIVNEYGARVLMVPAENVEVVE